MNWFVCETLQNERGDLLEKFNGKGWWLRFMECWPKLALRKGNALAQPRDNAVTETNVHGFVAPILTRGLWMHCECINKAPSGI